MKYLSVLALGNVFPLMGWNMRNPMGGDAAIMASRRMLFIGILVMGKIMREKPFMCLRTGSGEFYLSAPLSRLCHLQELRQRCALMATHFCTLH